MGILQNYNGKVDKLLSVKTGVTLQSEVKSKEDFALAFTVCEALSITLDFA